MEIKNDIQQLVPYKPTHPGSIIADELEYLGISHKDFALLIGMQPTHFSSLIKGKRPISADVALRIEQNTDLKAEHLMALQSKYEVDCKRIEKQKIDNSKAETKLSEYSAIINLSLLIKIDEIPLGDPSKILAAFNDKFASAYDAVSSMDNKLFGYFKKSEKVQTDARNLRTWIMLAIYYISKCSCLINYIKGNAELAAKDIADKANQGGITVKDISEILNNYGILFCHVNKFDKVPVDAFSIMSESGHPAIVVTYRYNDMDKLVFDILHELGHVSLHFSKGNSFIKIGDEPSSADIEVQADTFAKNNLIPSNVWRAILQKGSESVVSLSFNNIVNCIAKRAVDYGINPTIAVARYKKESGQYNTSRFKSPKIF